MERLATQLEEEEKDEVAPSPPHATNLEESFSPTDHANNNNDDFSGEEIAAAATAAAAATPVARTLPTQSARAAKKTSPPGTTTARKSKKTKASTSMKNGCRVFTTRKSLVTSGILTPQQQEALRFNPQSYRFYGTNLMGTARTGYNVEYDLLPQDHKIVHGIGRGRLKVLDPGADKPTQLSTMEEIAAATLAKAEKAKKKMPYQLSVKAFKSMSPEEKATAKLFQMDVKEDIHVDWKILQDDEHLEEADDPLVYPTELEFKKEVDFVNKPFDEIFFDDFFPSVTGHAALFDEYFNDNRAPYHSRVKEEKISFNRPDDEDPDWIVKQCYLLMIAAVTEPEIGVDNLWKAGEGRGRHPHADFGLYIPKNTFKAFLVAAPIAFAPKELWYEAKKDIPWAFFSPVVKGLNEKRQQLFRTVLLMLDESMSGWRPKTTLTGLLPNITHEPRKPVPLGTQFKNAVECLSGCFVFQDIVMQVEMQRRKKYYFVDGDAERLVRTCSLVPGKPEITASCAETLRQVEGANLERGGWVGGDAWFGSVQTAVELFLRFGVYSTFIVKNNTNLFPMAVLNEVLKARHSRQAGHWVVMTATINEINVRAIAYAWSQKGVSYFVTTCGKTTASPFKYECKFEDEWGNADFKEIPRPDIVHFFYEYAPLIDEHNKARQAVIALEKRWPTRNPWFRLLTTVVGISIVDMYRVYRHNMLKIEGNNQRDVDGLQVITFSDWLCGNLRKWEYKTIKKTAGNKKGMLERIRDDEGYCDQEPTAKKREQGRTVGNPVVAQCFICQGYLDKDGKTTYRPTSYWCKDCHMPICQQSHVGCDGG